MYPKLSELQFKGNNKHHISIISCDSQGSQVRNTSYLTFSQPTKKREKLASLTAPSFLKFYF